MILDWINLDEFLPLLVLICLLVFIGGQVSAADGRSRVITRRIAYGAFVLYAGTAIFEWGASSVNDFIGIVVRALLASGVVYGLALLLLPIGTCAYEHTVGTMIAKNKVWSDDARKRAEVRAARERDEQAERERRSPQAEQERQRKADEVARAERERYAKIDDARAEVLRFYDEHASLLADALPPALLRSRLQNRFPENVTPEQAWIAAHDEIAAMLPLIGQAREKQRAAQDEAKKAEEKANEDERKLKEKDDAKDAVRRITDWYQTEKANLENTLPPGTDRENLLIDLFDRYDQLLKQNFREFKP